MGRIDAIYNHIQSHIPFHYLGGQKGQTVTYEGGGGKPAIKK